MIILMLLWTLASHPFKITVWHTTTGVDLHYPRQDEHFTWKYVCVTTHGKTDDKYNPGDYVEYDSTSCWTPRFLLEQYKLQAGALTVRGLLTAQEDNHEIVIDTGVVRVRPEPGAPETMRR